MHFSIFGRRPRAASAWAIVLLSTVPAGCGRPQARPGPEPPPPAGEAIRRATDALGGAQALARAGGLIYEADLEVVSGPGLVRGTAKSWLRFSDGASRTESDYGAAAYTTVFDGARVWLKGARGAATDATAQAGPRWAYSSALLRGAHLSAPADRWTPARADADTASYDLSPDGGEPLRVTFDRHRWLLVRAEALPPAPPAVLELSDWRSVGTVAVPFVRVTSQAGVRSTIRLRSVRLNPRFDPALLAAP